MVKLEDVVEECDNLAVHIELGLSWKSSTEWAVS